ncbi:MAG: hypothetical protein PHD67_11345, partial [Oscillospiraceae bacterium]|nr:hypothetical protein [Oscillospiraceae bacterium]
MKKLICAMVAIALLLACAGGAALAESGADARQFMDASVKERTNAGKYTPIRKNITVEAENCLAFTLIGVNYYQTLNTLILLRAELEIGLTEKAQAEGKRGYTFNDLEFVLYGSDGAEETLHYLSRAYVLDGDLAQEVVLPISIPDEGTVKVVLEYLLPNATRTLCLIDTNLLGGSNDIYQVMGNIFAYVTHRTPNDFYLFCHSDKAVAQA